MGSISCEPVNRGKVWMSCELRAGSVLSTPRSAFVSVGSGCVAVLRWLIARSLNLNVHRLVGVQGQFGFSALINLVKAVSDLVGSRRAP